MSAMIEALLFEWRKNGQRARQLMANIPEALKADQAGGIVNHPAWCLGHLVFYHPAVLAAVRGETLADPNLSPEAPLYANGSKPSADPSVYPALAELAERFAQGHACVEEAIEAMDPARLESDPPLERWKTAFGKTAIVLVHLMVAHETHHLAEISAWKKAHGLPVLG